MYFAMNYSPQAAGLLAAGRIEVDLFKLPPWPDTVAEVQASHRAYVHFDLRAGAAQIDPPTLDTVERLRDQSQTQYVNVHLSPHLSQFPGMEIDSIAGGDAQRVLDALLRDIDRVTERFGREVVILENLPSVPAEPYAIPRPAIEPDLIQAVIGRTGCGLLLDTAHAVMAAEHLQIDPRRYIEALPVDRLAELHITGIARDEAGEPDDHFALTADDWALTEWVAGKVAAGDWPAPWALTFEYGGIGDLFAWRSDSDVIAEQAPRLKQLVAECGLRDAE
jgi:uncharacterized protein (UPF0276 family)